MKNVLWMSCVALAGCATGLGIGETRGAQQQPISFEFQAADSREGELIAVRENGARFTGPYHQVALGEVDRVSPGVLATRPAVSGFIFDTPYEEETLYGPELVATLRSATGEVMRCRLALQNVEQGIEGGATGPCSLSTGEKVRVVFPSTELHSTGPAGIDHRRGG